MFYGRPQRPCAVGEGDGEPDGAIKKAVTVEAGSTRINEGLDPFAHGGHFNNDRFDASGKRFLCTIC